MNKKRNVFIFTIVFFISLFVFFASSIADARAGGGHRSGGSRSSSRSSSRSHSSSRSYGRSSHSSSHSSSGSGDPLNAISCFTLALLLLLGYLLDSKPKSDSSDYSTYSFKEITNLYIIRAKDPNFNKKEFLERVKKAFIIVQEGWSNRDLSKAEAFLADGTYEQFLIQINTMKADHEIDLMKNINIKEAIIVRLESKAGYDSIHVLFTVEAINYRIDDRTNEFLNGSKQPEEFSEIWTFMRRTGTKTINNGLIEGYCPNCGTKVKGTRLSKCPSCSSLLRSGQHDWILVGITQASEWRNTHVAPPIAYNSIIKEDPALNIQHLEDKLSLLFWRMVEANRVNNPVPIEKVSTSDFALAFENLQFEKAFPKCKECYIRYIEVIGFITNQPDYNYLIGQIVWGGHLINQYGQIFKKSLFILRRKKEVVSDSGKCFCSSHCPNCGAPEPNNLSLDTCAYCNSFFNDDSKDWMLTDVVDLYSSEASKYKSEARKSEEIANTASGNKTESTINANTSNKMVSSVQNTNLVIYDINYSYFDYISGKDLLSITVAMMLADDVIDSREMEIINKIKIARNITNAELNQTITQIRKAGNPIQFVLDTTSIELDENLIKLLINIAAADNNIADSEIRFLQSIAKRMGLPEKRLRDLINEVYEAKWSKN